MKINKKQYVVRLVIASFLLCVGCWGNVHASMAAELDAAKVGSKAANLAFLTKAGVLSVPKWQAVGVEVFQRVVSDNASIAQDISNINCMLHSKQPLGNVFAVAQRLRTKITQVEFSPQDLNTIKAIYDQVSDFGKYPVAVRSSATKEDLPGMSFAGLYDSFLNQQSFAAVRQSVASCMASLFNDRAIQYYRDNDHQDLDIGSTHMGVIIQRMVNAASSGTAFSVDVATGAPCIHIAAASGTEGVVSGIANADTFIVSPVNFKIIKLTPGASPCSAIAGAINDRVAKLSLSFAQAKDLAKAVAQLKRQYAQIYDGDIDTEFAVDQQGKIHLLQIRPLFLSSKKTITDIGSAVDLNKVKIIARGADAVAGVTVGKIKIIEEFADLRDGRVQIEPEDIIVTNRAENNWTQFFVNFAGIVATEGSATSHPMLIARERDVPCLIGVPDAVTALRPYQGQYVTLDGIRKCIYLGKLPLVEKSLQEASLLFDIVQPAIVPTNAEALHELKTKGRLLVQADENWLRPIMYPLAPMLLEMYENGIRTDEKILAGIGCRKCRAFAKKIMTINGQIYVKWTHPPGRQLEMLQDLSLDNCENFLAQKDQVLARHLEASENFVLNKQSMLAFQQTRENLIAYMDLDYAISTHVTHKVYELAHNDSIPKFYLEEFSRYVQSTMIDGDVEKTKESAKLANEIAGKYHSMAEIAAQAPALYHKIVKFAKAYKFDSSENWPTQAPLDSAYALIGKHQGYKDNFNVAHTVAVVQYFPENVELARWAKLWILLKGAQNSGHHVRVKSLWLIKDKLVSIVDVLVARGVLKQASDVLGMKLEQLMKLL